VKLEGRIERKRVRFAEREREREREFWGGKKGEEKRNGGTCNSQNSKLKIFESEPKI